MRRGSPPWGGGEIAAVSKRPSPCFQVDASRRAMASTSEVAAPDCPSCAWYPPTPVSSSCRSQNKNGCGGTTWSQQRRSTATNHINECMLLSWLDVNTNGTNGSGCKSCSPLKDYYIPDYILKPDSEQVIIDNTPSCDVVVFINSRNGGQLGSGFIKAYREFLNEAQVPGLTVGEAVM